MRALAILVDLLYWLSLVIWTAALAGAGVAAMGAFTTLPRAGVVLPDFEPYLVASGGDASDFGRIAAGMMMEPIFTATDFVQVAVAGIALVTLAVQVTVFQSRWPLRRLSNAVRGACIVAATGLVAYHTIVMAPPMNAALRNWWDAARRNDVAAAEYRAEFDAFHVAADRLFRVRLALVLVAVGASAVAAVPGSTRRDEDARTPLLARTR